MVTIIRFFAVRFGVVPTHEKWDGIGKKCYLTVRNGMATIIRFFHGTGHVVTTLEKWNGIEKSRRDGTEWHGHSYDFSWYGSGGNNDSRKWNEKKHNLTLENSTRYMVTKIIPFLRCTVRGTTTLDSIY